MNKHINRKYCDTDTARRPTRRELRDHPELRPKPDPEYVAACEAVRANEEAIHALVRDQLDHSPRFPLGVLLRACSGTIDDGSGLMDSALWSRSLWALVDVDEWADVLAHGACRVGDGVVHVDGIDTEAAQRRLWDFCHAYCRDVHIRTA